MVDVSGICCKLCECSIREFIVSQVFKTTMRDMVQIYNNSCQWWVQHTQKSQWWHTDTDDLSTSMTGDAI